MNTKRSHEGYLLIDHRVSPGVPDALMVPQGYPVGSGRGVFESPTYTCSHCEAVVVMNPDRSRPRTWCKKCDHYICDACGAQLAATGICYPFKARVNDLLSKV